MSTIPITRRGLSHSRPVLRRRHAADHGAHRQGRVLPALAANERVLAHADLAARGVVTGTDRALHLRAANSVWRRIAWIDVASVAWSPRTAALVLRLWSLDENAATEVQVPSDREFAAFAAERVSATQLLCRRIRLAEAGGATVTALREPGDDAVTWRVWLDADIDQADPAVALAVRRTLAELRALAGC